MTRVCMSPDSSGRCVTGPEDDTFLGDVELGFTSPQVDINSLPHADPGPTGQADKFAAVKLILGRPDQSDLNLELGIFRETGACTHTDTHVARTRTHAHARAHTYAPTHAHARAHTCICTRRTHTHTCTCAHTCISTHPHTHTQSLPRIYLPHLLLTHAQTLSLSLSHIHTHTGLDNAFALV